MAAVRDTMSTPLRARSPASVVLTLFLPFAAGYFLSWLFRTVNAVIADDLSASLGLDPAALGLLTSAYFIAFAAVQLPIGILLDRFGPRRVEAALLVVAAAGALLFSLAESLPVLAAARALIGLGVAACLMAAMKNSVIWWPKQRLPLINGLILAAGGLGAFAATTPVHALLGLMDWRGVFQVLALLTLANALYVWLAVPEAPGDPPRIGGLAAQLRGVAVVYRSRFFWRLTPVTVLVQATFMSYLGLWAGPWLRDIDGFGRDEVAWHLQLIPITMTIGYIVTGGLTERLSRLGLRPIAVAGTLMGLFAVNQATLLVPGLVPTPIHWALFGFLGSASALSYSILTQGFPSELAGRVTTALNLLTFVGAFLAQSGVGAVIAAFPGGTGGFDPAGHRLAVAVLLVMTLAAFAWFLWPHRNAPPGPAQ